LTDKLINDNSDDGKGGTSSVQDNFTGGARGRTAVVGVGESPYYKRGASPDPEFVLTLKAILNAAADAGIDARSIDGFVSYSDDRSTANQLANALGVHELRWSTMQWGGGGAGSCGAILQAAAAIAAGFAERVVVFRGLRQTPDRRFGSAQRARVPLDSLRVAYGVSAPAEMYAPRMQRFMHEHGISPSTQKAVSLAAYHHAQRNPRAVMHGRPLTSEAYDQARWIVEPWRLYDCCQENDGAAAIILCSAEHAADLVDRPVYVLGGAMGSGPRAGGISQHVYDSPTLATSEFTSLAPRAFAMAGVSPKDIDVVQFYENFTGGVVMALIEHGFCAPEEANEFITLENLIAPFGKLPLNTSGGNLAEAYIHGQGLAVEAVRQLRGQSCNQVDGARLCLVAGGPMVTPASNVIFGTKDLL
jgi:acetyl-CoA acetyltransferase